MKRMTVFVILVVAFTACLHSQDEDEKGQSRTHYAPQKVGGAGGFMPGWGLFKFTEINKTLRSAGMPTLQSNSMYLLGGIGYGYIMVLPNVRMGGMGIGGTVTTQMIDARNVKKEVEYSVSYGGFLVDYVVRLADRLDCSAGLTIGGGSVNVTMTSDNGSFKQWNTLWNQFGNGDSTVNFTRHLEGSFFTLQPNVNIEYALLHWFQIRVGVGYPLMLSPSWKLDNGDAILNVPSGMKADGPVVTAGIMFGFFN